MDQNSQRQPKTLWLLTWCYSLFMAAFGGILASLVLYQTKELHMTTSTAYGVFAAAMALLWILPLGGGFAASKLGYKQATNLGLIVCGIGMACFCFSSTNLMYVGLALFVVGNALFTPAVWCMIDFCYHKESNLREAGFTLFYLYFNLGAVLGIFIGGWLADTYSFAVEFALDSICIFIAFILLLSLQKRIVPYPGRSIEAQIQLGKVANPAVLLLLTVVFTVITLFLFQYLTVNNVLMFLLMAIMCVVLWRIAHKQATPLAKNKLIAFIFMAIIAIAFWTLYSLEPSFLSVFIQNNVDTRFLGINIPASSFFAFDGVFVILVGLVLSRVWLYLSKKNKNPSLSIKFAGSLVIIGLGFAFIAVMIIFNGNHHLLPAYVIVIAYAIFSTGELMVSPLGISMVGSLAPAGQEGLMMGFWQLSTGIGGVVSGYIATWPNLPDVASPLMQSNPIYIKTFFFVGLGSVLLGIIVLLFSAKLNKLMKEAPYKVPQI